MKTVASDRTHIDYWHWRGYGCAGVRVWPDRCRAIASDPDHGPEGLAEYGAFHGIPLQVDGKSRRVIHSDDPPLAGEIIWHVVRDPDSDLLEVVTGKKPFHEA